MFKRMRMLAAVLALSLVPVAGCLDRHEEKETERWATTANTNVAIDWDKVNEAYKATSGPEDFEKRVNEIYEGDEVISIAVLDVSDKVQEVTGFFDKNTNGTVEEEEKIFTIKREITGEGTANVQTTGHGYYAGYHSPVLGIMTGMMLGSMLSSAFMPGYAPMYSRPYVTPASRVGDLRNGRASYRAANPAKFRPKASGSGRTYNAPRSTPRPRGGGRFGVRRSASVSVRLEA